MLRGAEENVKMKKRKKNNNGEIKVTQTSLIFHLWKIQKEQTTKQLNAIANKK